VFDKSWRCVQGVKGRYTMAYFDFVEDPTSSLGAYLYVTNDWIIDGESGAVPNDCYNVFHVATGAGREQWEVRVYGDATVWVAKNGVMMQERHDPVGGAFGGATGFGPSPNVAFNHTIFELRFPASTGRVKMQLGDPVRTVDGPMNTAAQEAASMHRSATGGGGCTEMTMVDEPNNVTIEAKPEMWDPPDPDSNATESPVQSTCTMPPCDFFDESILITWAPSWSPSASPTRSPSMSPTLSRCRNGVKDEGETDVDCGGGCPGTCGFEAGCCVDGDCMGSRAYGRVKVFRLLTVLVVRGQVVRERAAQLRVRVALALRAVRGLDGMDPVLEALRIGHLTEINARNVSFQENLGESCVTRIAC